MNYLIVGASSGLGRDLAYKFSQNSHNIILVSRDERDLKALQSDIESKFNSKVSIFDVDCSSHEKVDVFIKTNLDIFKNLDGVLFPIGMVFDDDTVNNNISKTNELLQANYGIVSHIVSLNF